MMIYQHIEEWLSRAYVMTIAARAGVNILHPLQDYGVDGTFSKIQLQKGKPRDTGIKLDYQLKASKNWRIEGEEIVYALEAKTFNDLTARFAKRRTVPLILILLCLPQETAQWMEQSEEQLIVRRCCYWAKFVGGATDNSRSVTIRISRQQIFTPEVLTDLLNQLEEEAYLS